MRAVVQRVSKASVSVENKTVSEVNRGYLILLGVEERDELADAEWLAGKIASLRIFSDEEGKMNLDIKQVKGQCIVVSQFTLHAKYKKGTRPSFIKAAKPEKAEALYLKFGELLSKETGAQTQFGVFGADMQVSLINDGPVTILLDTQNKE